MIYSYRRVCRGTMEREAAEARYRAQHGEKSGHQFHNGKFTKWSSERSRETPYAYDEGVTIGVDTVDRSPWDEYTTKPDASPFPPIETEPTTPQ